MILSNRYYRCTEYLNLDSQFSLDSKSAGPRTPLRYDRFYSLTLLLLTTMSPSATLEYSSSAPQPISPNNISYPRLSSHHLLPSNRPDYLRLILTSKVYEIIKETPLVLATNLSAKLGNQIWLKREDLQEVFSFKIRGAYNFMASLSDEERWKGVVTCSAG